MPLFLLPYIILPWLGYNGLRSTRGAGKACRRHAVPARGLRPRPRVLARVRLDPGLAAVHLERVHRAADVAGGWSSARSRRSCIIPLIICCWGKGAYCGWICSCGALAETLGDSHRHKMPHGPLWNRLNMIGQVILVFAFVLLVVARRRLDLAGDRWPARSFHCLLCRKNRRCFNYATGSSISSSAGILGVGLYFWFSGRVWCRFACPLAALMHIYARFSRFRIFADKKKCISCNVCTSVCHQGIDIMNFANKGLPMEDPECVRCSACVAELPDRRADLRARGRPRRPGCPGPRVARRVLGSDGRGQPNMTRTIPHRENALPVAVDSCIYVPSWPVSAAGPGASWNGPSLGSRRARARR